MELSEAEIEAKVVLFEGFKVPAKGTKSDIVKTLEAGNCKAIESSCIRYCMECIYAVNNQEGGQDKVGALHNYLEQQYPEKIAVHCPTQELWDRVSEKAGIIWDLLTWGDWGESSCIVPGSPPQRSNISYWRGEDYKIISAAEFLGEEGIVGDKRIDLLEDGDHIIIEGTPYTISKLNTEEDMNASIKKVYGDTRTSNEVDTVNKYFHDIPQSPYGEMFLEKFKEDIFKKAKALQKEEDTAKKKD
ncbi:MAG: hypothetical protein KAR40_09525 [Candidatus Sabulitectum sp.]|nr:hypothetical protein [Candidatus Sabulitectum sp.]